MNTRAGAAENHGDPAPALAYIGMGANLGDARGTLARAAQDIAALPGILSCVLSPLYRSAPVDAGGPDYVNGVLKTETTLDPETLLLALQDIEHRHGRRRSYRNAPRSLDLDLLLHGAETRETAFLTLPHPRMHERAFVLRPLLDIEPGIRLPQGCPRELLTACGGQRLERLPDN